MYDVALTVLSCLRAGTDVRVAWIASGPLADPTQAVALTPGGGRIGSLLGGALDHLVGEASIGLGEGGGLVDLAVGPTEALIAGLTPGDPISVAIIDGGVLPAETWEAIAERRSVGFELAVEDGRFTAVGAIDPRGTSTRLEDDRLVCSLSPTSRVVIGGGGPMADALGRVFDAAGWEVAVLAGPDAAGLMATLSPADAAVVLGHDVEASSRVLQAAIESDAGYIGSIGSERMQQLRGEWLAYRNVDVPERVHGPAGLAIGASDPGEVAVAVAAEAIAFLAGIEDPRPKP